MMTGNKLSLWFGTKEHIKKVSVEMKSFTCLYTEKNTAFLIEPNMFDQLQVPLDLFGKSAAYLKEEMKVALQLYDGRLLTALVPNRVTCTIKETQTQMKGVSATPRYKKNLAGRWPSNCKRPNLPTVTYNKQYQTFYKRQHQRTFLLTKGSPPPTTIDCHIQPRL